MFDLCIIGGGAAGMAAAVTAKKINKNLSILLLEKMEKTGKKILASGNGKCNLSNLSCERYEETEEFFSELGLLTRNDDAGRVYPYTEESAAVSGALMMNMKKNEVCCVTGCEVKSVSKDENFHIMTDKKTYTSRKILIATGGKSGPQFGSTGDGYRFAKSFGHTITKLIPVLTAVETEENISAFAGIRAKGKVSLNFKDKEIFAERGEIQFTKTGISGICVFNLSRYLLIPDGCPFKDGFKDYTIYIDFAPEISDIDAFLQKRSINRNLEGENLLKYIVRDRIADDILYRSDNDICRAGKLLKNYPLHPQKVKGWNFAQVTKGGVNLDEVNMETMESKICRGLFFAGEVLDFDGPCGGYNLQNAWETGIRAGKGMANG